jgi:hypothetical protein
MFNLWLLLTKLSVQDATASIQVFAAVALIVVLAE